MRVLLSAILCLGLGCSTQGAVSNQGFVWQGHLFNLRVGYKLTTAADVQAEQGSEAMSKQTAEMLEAVLPQLIEAAVKAALGAAGIGAAGSLLDSCDVGAIFDKAKDDGGVVLPGEESESDKTPGPRRTPAEKEAAQAERGSR